MLASAGASMNHYGALILCGGRSSRMGRDKASLPLGAGETMLGRVVAALSQAVPAERIVCVAAPGQVLPALDPSVRIVYDQESHGGPLVGLVAGLAATDPATRAVFVCGCDVPLLVPTLVGRMFALLGEDDIAAPHDGARWHPLAAVYRTSVWPAAEDQLATGPSRSLVALLERCRTRRVSIDELRDVDPRLDSLAPCNTLDDYHRLTAG